MKLHTKKRNRSSIKSTKYNRNLNKYKRNSNKYKRNSNKKKKSYQGGSAEATVTAPAEEEKIEPFSGIPINLVVKITEDNDGTKPKFGDTLTEQKISVTNRWKYNITAYALISEKVEHLKRTKVPLRSNYKVNSTYYTRLLLDTQKMMNYYYGKSKTDKKIYYLEIKISQKKTENEDETTVQESDFIKRINNKAFRKIQQAQSSTKEEFKFLYKVEINAPNLEIIGEDAFNGCKHLSYLGSKNEIQEMIKTENTESTNNFKAIIPPSVTTIRARAFMGCETLKELIIPPSVKMIGSHAFKGCIGLLEVTIPNSVIIAENAFENCGSIKKVYSTNRLLNEDLLKGIFRNDNLDIEEKSASVKTEEVFSGFSGFLDPPTQVSRDNPGDEVPLSAKNNVINDTTDSNGLQKADSKGLQKAKRIANEVNKFFRSNGNYNPDSERCPTLFKDNKYNFGDYIIQVKKGLNQRWKSRHTDLPEGDMWGICIKKEANDEEAEFTMLAVYFQMTFIEKSNTFKYYKIGKDEYKADEIKILPESTNTLEKTDEEFVMKITTDIDTEIKKFIEP